MKSSTARTILVLLWLVGFAVLFMEYYVVLSPQRYSNAFAGDWLMSNVAPTMGLIIGAAIAQRWATTDSKTNLSLFFLALVPSVVYLAVLVLAPIKELFAPPTHSPEQFLRDHSSWLGPIQGFVDMGLSLFFVESNEKHRARSM